MIKLRLIPFLFPFLLAACQRSPDTLFERVDSEESGITFNNTIEETEQFNILTEEYIYNGGGVGVGDFNQDGLPDLFFTGNHVNNELYLNQGDFRFRVIGAEAGILGEGRWCSGVAVVDINQDGWDDAYVSVTIDKDPEKRRNLLFVNQGLNAEGIPTFEEQAATYGIDDSGNTTHAAFFDYDKDGDLDLYLLTNVIDTSVPGNYRIKITDGSALNNDRLYRNNGDNTFTNVTKEAGIVYEGFGLGVAISDLNFDGWPDIYITNDYISNDLLYINNQDGTFTNRLEDYIDHASHSAMGNDVVDLNNDGMVDILALDMLPETNERKKKMIGANSYIKYINNDQYRYQYQYVRNTLQLNYGLTPEGHPVFGEIGQYANLYQTDWSWTPLVVDFDNDGFRDVIITNGFPKDVTDKDFALYVAGPAGRIASNMYLQDSIPIVKISNYAFRNNGDVTFSDVTVQWGMHIPSFSNGAVYVDLDGDGDQDVVTNNINEEAFLFRNQLEQFDNENQQFNYLQVAFEGEAPNRDGFGAKVSVFYEGKQLFYEHSPSRGYISSVSPTAHFGLGDAAAIDSLGVQWPDGRTQWLTEVPANQRLVLKQAEAGDNSGREFPLNQVKTAPPLVQRAEERHQLHFYHQEKDIVDFDMQRTLPHKYSQQGPGIAVADVNGDGLEDFAVSGSVGHLPTLFLQQTDGTFAPSPDSLNFAPSKPMENLGMLFFDADMDGDADLYLTSGSYEHLAGDSVFQDQLYFNNGQGQFQLSEDALPPNLTSTAAVKAADFDADGDLDLFVGGRVKPMAYPMPVSSFILQNNGGTFTDISQQVCPDLQDLGMVTDGLWTDFNGDGQTDLIVVGEWMPVTFFQNSGGQFQNVTQQTGLAEMTGWWNSLAAADFDYDGDMDYVAGNLGLNTQYRATPEQPLSVLAKDFDNSGSIDPVLSMYYKNAEGTKEAYPMASLDDLIAQMQMIRRNFHRYEPYSHATIDELFTAEQLEGVYKRKATHFASSYLENKGDGTFAMRNLPMETQLGPIYGMLPHDLDADGITDLLLVGNDYGTEVFTGRYDALIGVVLKGDGKGGFTPLSASKSGFYVDGDAKALARLHFDGGKSLLLATQNQDSLTVLSPRTQTSLQSIRVAPLAAYAEVTLNDGRQQRIEFFYGNTYLSQSGRIFQPPAGMKEYQLFGFDANRLKSEL